MASCICLNCGKTFETYPSVIKKGGGKYCSSECRSKKVDCVCLYCYVEFQTFLSETKRGGGKYCSPECYHEHRSQENRTDRICQHCQKSFTVTKSALKDGRGVFCSQGCCDEARSIKRVCEQCNKPFYAWRNQVKQGKARFCSRKCVTSFLSRKVYLACQQCGATFTVKPSHKHKSRFCSMKCHGEWKSENLTGENSPTWKGGSITYYGPNWPIQRRKARRRDKYQCQYCGKSEKKNDRELDVHHIKPFREFGYISGENDNYKEANRLTNLISLCLICHRKAEIGVISFQLYLI